jgi:hypothetical protein
MTGGVLASRFPRPPGPVSSALDEIRIVAGSAEETEHEARRVALLARPWDPASCPPELRRRVYEWLHDVVAWINEDHTWRTDRVVPGCWDLHPHIVHELATVACLRWEASFARTPKALEEWHRVTLPTFLDRIARRIGETGCPPGRHQTNPGASRNQIYRASGDAGRQRSHRWDDAENQGLSR